LDENAPICAAFARCEEGICVELKHLGETCASDDVCLSERCEDGECVLSSGCR
jgi:hypothetical protein